MTKLKIGLEDAFGTIGTVETIKTTFITQHEDEVFHVIWDDMNHFLGMKLMKSKSLDKSLE